MERLPTIVNSLIEIGYDVIYKVMNSKDYGSQNRKDFGFMLFWNFTINFSFRSSKESLKYFPRFLDKNPEKAFKSENECPPRGALSIDFRVKETACVDLYNKNIRGDGISVTIFEPHHNKMRIVPPKNNELLMRIIQLKNIFG